MNIQSYEQALDKFDGNNPGPLRPLVQQIMSTDIDWLIEHSGDSSQQQIANSWLVKAWVDAGGSLSVDQMTTLATAFFGYIEWGAKLHFYQLLESHEVPLQLRGKVHEIARNDIHHEKTTVQAWSYYALAKTALSENKSEVKELLESKLLDSKGAVAVRIKRALKLL